MSAHDDWCDGTGSSAGGACCRAMTEPETAAGRALLGRLWAVNEYSQASRIIATVQVDILAIEAEARAKTLDEVAAAVATITEYPNYNPDEGFDEGWNAVRERVIGDIDSLRETP